VHCCTCKGSTHTCRQVHSRPPCMWFRGPYVLGYPTMRVLCRGSGCVEAGGVHVCAPPCGSTEPSRFPSIHTLCGLTVPHAHSSHAVGNTGPATRRPGVPHPLGFWSDHHLERLQDLCDVVHSLYVVACVVAASGSHLGRTMVGRRASTCGRHLGVQGCVADVRGCDGWGMTGAKGQDSICLACGQGCMPTM
jgi:hypothetical protein